MRTCNLVIIRSPVLLTEGLYIDTLCQLTNTVLQSEIQRCTAQPFVMTSISTPISAKS
jgi:hypothetical protein